MSEQNMFDEFAKDLEENATDTGDRWAMISQDKKDGWLVSRMMWNDGIIATRESINEITMLEKT